MPWLLTASAASISVLGARRRHQCFKACSEKWPGPQGRMRTGPEERYERTKATLAVACFGVNCVLPEIRNFHVSLCRLLRLFANLVRQRAQLGIVARHWLAVDYPGLD